MTADSSGGASVKTYRSASGLAVPFDYLVNWQSADSRTELVLGWASTLENAHARARDFADRVVGDYNQRRGVAAGTPHAAVIVTTTMNSVANSASAAGAGVVTVYTIERPLVVGWIWNSAPKHICTVTVRTIVHVNDAIDVATLQSPPPPMAPL